MTAETKPQLPSRPTSGTWVQTDRATHEEWAKLSLTSPRASALLHHLAAQVGDHNAVVISQGALAKAMGCSRRTIIRAVEDLVAGRWIQLVQIGASNTVHAYQLNDSVVWHGPRDGLRFSKFSATVIAVAAEQPPSAQLEEQPTLRRLPKLFPGERQLPSGPGQLPPSQPFLDGMEPDLPATELADPSEVLNTFANRLRAPD